MFIIQATVGWWSATSNIQDFSGHQ